MRENGIINHNKPNPVDKSGLFSLYFAKKLKIHSQKRSDSNRFQDSLQG